jgi:hypothetical protein
VTQQQSQPALSVDTSEALQDALKKLNNCPMPQAFQGRKLQKGEG